MLIWDNLTGITCCLVKTALLPGRDGGDDIKKGG
jgi:hypothetical protein|tara:strand:- start:53 stop:154 length:102 start_codon:yes stop_codon:yes gene_type:complete